MCSVDFCLEKFTCIVQSRNPTEIVHFINETRNKCALFPSLLSFSIPSPKLQLRGSDL
jgi:hypothetical protein